MNPHHFSDPFLNVPSKENHCLQLLHFKFYMWCKLPQNTVNVAADGEFNNVTVIHVYFWPYSAFLQLSAVNSGWTTPCRSSVSFLCSSLAVFSSGCWCLSVSVSCARRFPQPFHVQSVVVGHAPPLPQHAHTRRESRQMLCKRGTNRISLSCSLS